MTPTAKIKVIGSRHNVELTAIVVGQRRFDVLPMNLATRRVSEGITVSYVLAYASG